MFLPLVMMAPCPAAPDASVTTGLRIVSPDALMRWSHEALHQHSEPLLPFQGRKNDPVPGGLNAVVTVPRPRRGVWGWKYMNGNTMGIDQCQGDTSMPMHGKKECDRGRTASSRACPYPFRKNLERQKLGYDNDRSLPFSWRPSRPPIGTQGGDAGPIPLLRMSTPPCPQPLVALYLM